MSTTYDWVESFGVNQFEMRVAHNTRAFLSPFSSTAQVLNYTGERWQVTIGLVPAVTRAESAAREAFFDRLNGPANTIRLWNLRRPFPLGTLRDGGGTAVWHTNTGATATWSTSAPAIATWSYSGPVLYADVAVGANQIPIHRTAGTTVEAGDHFSVGGQLFRAMARAVFNARKEALVEVQPRVRVALLKGAAVTCTRPTANFMLKTDGVAIKWQPGMSEGVSFDLIEAP